MIPAISTLTPQGIGLPTLSWCHSRGLLTGLRSSTRNRGRELGFVVQTGRWHLARQRFWDFHGRRARGRKRLRRTPLLGGPLIVEGTVGFERTGLQPHRTDRARGLRECSLTSLGGLLLPGNLRSAKAARRSNWSTKASAPAGIAGRRQLIVWYHLARSLRPLVHNIAWSCLCLRKLCG